MLELKKGEDILATVGGIEDIDQARELFSRTIDADNQQKLAAIKNEEALVKIANAIAMCKPDNVFVNTGSAADVQWIKEYSLSKGEEKKLAKEGHTIHFDLPQDQARLVKQTFYIVNENEKMSSLAKTVPRKEAKEYVQQFMPGIMTGKTLIVGFYSRGPVGANAAIPAIEISSSGYVLHSAELLYRNCFSDFDAEVERCGLFFTNLHSEGDNTSEDVPNARIFMDRSWLTTFATFCTYAGNTLLLKKGNHRFSVDYATYYKVEEQLAEHMFITGLTGPGGRKTFFAGAAPSGCGKTTTAMVGSDFIGDDLAQFWIDEQGILRAINPEKGIFGIVEDVNREGDPHLMDCLRGEGTEVIWSNVLIKDGVPYWVGNGETSPESGVNFQGEWFKGKTDEAGNPVPMSHKNSRCTLVASAIANHATELSEDPKGVPVKVITYSGRDSDTMPPVWVARNSDNGVAIGASIVSKATATEVGATGVNRQPWANAPFIPGALADYMKAQFTFFNSTRFSDGNRPIIAGLNYFLTHENRGGEGSGLLGEKRDVKVWLGWLELYAHGDVEGIETPIGIVPKYDDLAKLFATINKEYPKALYDMQFAIYVDKIIARIDLQTEAYSKEADIPSTLFEVYDGQKKELLGLKEKFGPVVQIDNLA
ncbi:phosphoenolpyruvate carboxykinase (GTP) [Desulforhopalus singaporensis]|uniref:Phosphoenolpyruvate carboxykinase [GTP] n=1 Tax=Desulforhopalus singaporensis TaxID=91360 RepID=A0A1H0R7Z8_9BACT|nr:phosphoenolpyruvate carboxykinase (GTP) [Desulforhopalus singaporensis]SDP25624.1 phosphoenolpyruvate carboxykinase (GTP) [Desulforhopalus singaporensis]